MFSAKIAINPRITDARSQRNQFPISNYNLQLDTVCRVLLDRKWTVGELAAATLDYAKDILDDEDTTRSTTSNTESRCLFEKLIGI